MRGDQPSHRRRRGSSSPKPQAAEPVPQPTSQRPSRRAQDDANERRRHRRNFVRLAVGLVALVLVVYWQTGSFEFIALDDPVYVSDNRHVQGGLTAQNVEWSLFGFHDGNWIPLTWLSLMLDTTLFGVRPGAYHLMNVALHAANAVLLFAFLTRATGWQFRSACVAALFALHPLHVESVAWVTERKDVLSTLFGLASLLTYVGYCKNHRRLEFRACFACFAASLLAKQTLVTLPFVFLLLDYWPLGRFGDRSARVRVVLEKVPFLVASLAFSIVAVIAQKSGHTVASLNSLPLLARCMNAVTVYATYLRQTFFPFHLAVYYPHPGANIAWGTVGACAALLIAVSAITVFRARLNPYLLVGWAWYLGTLVPMIGIVQVGSQQMADRYTYFPLIGLFIALVWLISDLASRTAFNRWTLPAAAAVCLVASGSAAFIQIGYWRDSITLFRHAVQSAPNNPLATSALGFALMSQGSADQGIALLESAVRLSPDDPQTQYNVAVGLQSVNRLKEAAEHYQAVLALNPNDADAHTNLGVLFAMNQRYPDAKQQFLEAVAINPEHVQAYVDLGTLCLDTRDYAEAITYSQRALALDPSRLNCHLNIGLALRAQGRRNEAIEQFKYVLSVSPNDPDANRELRQTLATPGGS
jgi:Tfp pilus assembly protein PilF